LTQQHDPPVGEQRDDGGDVAVADGVERGLAPVGQPVALPPDPEDPPAVLRGRRVVRPGRVIYEISGVPEESAREAMRLAAHKLPIPTRFVARVEM